MKNNYDELFSRISMLPKDKQESLYVEIKNIVDSAYMEATMEQRELECDLRGHVFTEWKPINLYQINDPVKAQAAEEKYGDLYGGVVGYERTCTSCGIIEQTLELPKELKKNK